MATDPAETLRGGRYAVLRVLGEGAQGETLEALDKREGRLVAIKRFIVKGAKSWKSVELAEREARVLRSLDHPALPRYREHFEEDGALYLVMDKLEGESVGSLLRHGETFSQRDVVRFLDQASDVLSYLHGRAPPVIHRDLKPGNVLRRPDGSFAFVDFGSVRDSLKPEGGSTVVGTFGYMAPEQFQGRALPGSDVYAVGATALAMLTRREPEDLPHRGLGIDVAAALGGQVSPGLVRVLGAMLEPDPDRRPGSLAPLLAELSDDPPAGAQRAAGGPPWADDWSKWTEASNAEAWGGPWAGRWQHRVDRAARRAERHAERWRRRTRGRPRAWQGSHAVPPIALVFAHFGLTVAEILLMVLFRAVVPVVLTLLSLVLGPGLRRAAARASELGLRISDELARARQRLAQPDSRERVADEVRPASRVRVTDAVEEDDGAEAPDRQERRH
jgi:hypothetical protein